MTGHIFIAANAPGQALPPAMVSGSILGAIAVADPPIDRPRWLTAERAAQERVEVPSWTGG